MNRPLNLGELIIQLQAAQAEVGPTADVMTVDGAGDTRQMWSVYAHPEVGVELFLTSED